MNCNILDSLFKFTKHFHLILLIEIFLHLCHLGYLLFIKDFCTGLTILFKIWSLFCRWGNWNSERPSILLISGGVRPEFTIIFLMTQGFELSFKLAKQFLYYWTMPPGPLASVIFQIGSYIFAWTSLEHCPPIYTFHVSGMTGSGTQLYCLGWSLSNSDSPSE
jgi:hypothetical protein